MKFLLHIPCPECVKEGKVVPKEYWRHGGSCEGFLYLDENGIISCSRCNKIAKISEMKLTCSCGKHSVVFPSLVGLAKALSMSGELKTQEDIRWLNHVLSKI